MSFSGNIAESFVPKTYNFPELLQIWNVSNRNPQPERSSA